MVDKMTIRMIFFYATLVHASPIVLTSENFDKQVYESGKNSFLKFYAPWCGHCKKMAPDWDTLGKEYSNSKDILIGKVDCTVEKDLCSKFKVSGYPTLKLFEPDENTIPEDYTKERTLESFKTFLSETITDAKCSMSTLESCSTEDRELVEKFASTKDTLTKDIEEWNSEINNADKEEEELLKSLQKQYENKKEEVEKLTTKLQKKIKLARKVLKYTLPEKEQKDEV